MSRPTERPYTTALYMLRIHQLGLSLADLEEYDYGFVVDMLTEKARDSEQWMEVATQEDFDQFSRG